jgi:hypothetical protein
MPRKTLTHSVWIFAMLALVFFLPLLTNGQSKDEVSVEYDRFKDLTTIGCPLEKIRQRLYLNFAVIYHGKEKVKDPLFSFEIITTQPLGGADFSHKGFKTVYFILDGDKRLKVELYEYLPEVLTNLIAETARMHLTEEEFNQLTSAKKLEAQWGNTEFEFDKKSLSDFYKVRQLYDARK